LARGAKDANLDPVRHAARAAALAEDRAVFHGYPQAGIGGIVEASAQSKCTLSEDYAAYAGVVAEATHKLRSAGIGGPYAIALGPRCFTGLSKTDMLKNATGRDFCNGMVAASTTAMTRIEYLRL